MSLLKVLWNFGYQPHGYCLLWEPWLIGTHVIADAVIALAYFSIPVALVTLVRRRRDIEFGWLFWCFATFILACGLTHVMSIVTLWQPAYGLEALVKVVTAIASIATAAVLWPLLPKAAALPSPGRLQAANVELAAMIAARDSALEALRAQIHQREVAEQALHQSQKLEAVGQLTGGIAHDFNNLLQAVEGNLELIARSPDDQDRVVRWSGNALDAVERGRALTGQLLAFSRKQRLDLASVRLAEILAAARDLIDRAVAPLSRLRIEPIDQALNVVADPLQLELAILNLAINARDAMPGGGTVTIRAERRSGKVSPDLPEGDYVAVEVADTGKGMTPDVRARALEPFYTTKEPGQGTGMGLSMVFGVVRQSGGTLEIETEEGKGTTITLLLRAATNSPARAIDGDDMAPSPNLAGHTILLVDDDAQVRNALAETLRAVGAEVIEGRDGQAGLAAAEKVMPDLLVVDFAMPELDGAAVASAVRERYPDLPVLIVTGFAESAKFDSIPGERPTVLRKPFQSNVLLQRIAQLLGV